MTKKRHGERPRLTGQNWLEWLDMAHSTLAATSQMIWQNETEKTANRELFGIVIGERPVPGAVWQHSLTWTGAILLCLSTEQSLKALAIRREKDKSCLKTHNLLHLWDELSMDDQQGIEQERIRLKDRVRGTRLTWGTLTTIRQIVEHHQATFEHARYYKENRRSEDKGALSANIDLWHAGLSAFVFARSYARDHRLGTGTDLLHLWQKDWR